MALNFDDWDDDDEVISGTIDDYAKDVCPEEFCRFFNLHQGTREHKNKCKEILDGVSLTGGTKLPRPSFVAQIYGCGPGAFINVYETKKRKTTLFSFTCERPRRRGGRTFYGSYDFDYNPKADARKFILEQGQMAYYHLLNKHDLSCDDYYADPKKALSSFEERAKSFKSCTSIKIYEITKYVVDYCQSVVDGAR